MASSAAPRAVGSSLAGAVSLFAIAILAFLSTAAGLRSFTAWPERYEATVKLRHLASHPGAYDAVLVGNSRLYRAFVPEVFDRRLEERGARLRSFNLAVPGMAGYEADHVLGRALEIGGSAIRYAFVQPTMFDPGLEAAAPRTRRKVSWHSLEQTSRAVRMAFALDLPARRRWRLTHEHLAFFGRHMTSYGLGPSTARRWFPKPVWPDLTTEEVELMHGYKALEMMDDPRTAARRQRFLIDRERRQRRASRLRRPSPVELPAPGLAALEEQLTGLRDAGVEPVLVLGPAAGRSIAFAEALRQQGFAPVLSFDDPERYPELFRPENRFDFGHLNRQGAELFSEAFADRVAEFLDQPKTE